MVSANPNGPPPLLLPPTTGWANRILWQQEPPSLDRTEYADYPVATAEPDFSGRLEGVACCEPDIHSKTGDAMKTEL